MSSLRPRDHHDLFHMYNLFTQILQRRMEKILDEKQTRDQAGFRKGHLTAGHFQTISQLIEKCIEFSRLLCIVYIDCAKVFGAIEHEAVFNPLGTSYNEKYVLK